MMKRCLKQKGIAVFLVLLIGMVLAVGAVNAQENIKETHGIESNTYYITTWCQP